MKPTPGGRVFDVADSSMDFIDSTDGLYQLCKDFVTPEMVMAEIGCFRGVSTAIWAQHCKTVYAIDAWLSQLDYHEIPRDWMEKAEPLFDKVCEKYPNIVKMKGMSVEMSRWFTDESLDMVYIDADHREPAVRADLTAWIPKIKHGGIISGHDWCQVGSIIPASRIVIYPEQSWAYRKGYEHDIIGTISPKMDTRTV